jgi:hypothetical protein
MVASVIYRFGYCTVPLRNEQTQLMAFLYGLWRHGREAIDDGSFDSNLVWQAGAAAVWSCHKK